MKSLRGRLDITEITTKGQLYILPSALYATNGVYSQSNYVKPKGISSWRIFSNKSHLKEEKTKKNKKTIIHPQE